MNWKKVKKDSSIRQNLMKNFNSREKIGLNCSEGGVLMAKLPRQT